MTIIVGSDCLNRNNYTDSGYTYIDYKNMSSSYTTLTDACLYIQYLYNSPSTIEIKTFLQQSGDVFLVYDSTTPIQLTTTGLINIQNLNLTVPANGYIGFYSDDARIFMTSGLNDPVDPSPLSTAFSSGNALKGTNFTFANSMGETSISLQASNLNATTGGIICTSNPSGASISLDGVDKGTVTPSALSNVTLGYHTVSYNLTGYHTCSELVEVVIDPTVTSLCTLIPIGTTITVGSNCLLRNNFTDAGYTYIDYKNPSTESFTLTNACMYIQYLFDSPSTIEIKTFLQQSGSIYQVYDSTPPIIISSTGLVNIPITLNVVQGCCIGFYSPNMRLFMTNGIDPVDPNPFSVAYASGNAPKGTNVNFLNYMGVTSISLQANNQVITTGSILCTSNPPGASIYLDGVSQGVITPTTLTDVELGSHTISYSLLGYTSCQTIVTVTAGSTVTATCTLNQIPTTGNILCTSTPSGASIYLDSINQGVVTPSTITNVTEGNHNISYSIIGYNSCQISVTVIAGSSVNASCTLTPLPTTGSISCTSTPSGASIYLDNINQGLTTPSTLTNITAGSHSISYNLIGYTSCQTTVLVIAGSTVSATCTLIQIPTICTWITDNGGANGLIISEIFNLVDAYIGVINIGFTPTIQQIFGCVDYYLGFISSGNSKTGCNF